MESTINLSIATPAAAQQGRKWGKSRASMKGEVAKKEKEMRGQKRWRCFDENVHFGGQSAYPTSTIGSDLACGSRPVISTHMSNFIWNGYKSGVLSKRMNESSWFWHSWVSFDLSYAVSKGNSGTSKNKGISLIPVKLCPELLNSKISPRKSIVLSTVELVDHGDMLSTRCGWT